MQELWIALIDIQQHKQILHLYNHQEHVHKTMQDFYYYKILQMGII